MPPILLAAGALLLLAKSRQRVEDDRPWWTYTLAGWVPSTQKGIGKQMTLQEALIATARDQALRGVAGFGSGVAGAGTGALIGGAADSLTGFTDAGVGAGLGAIVGGGLGLVAGVVGATMAQWDAAFAPPNEEGP